MEDYAAATFSTLFRDPTTRSTAWSTLHHFRAQLPDKLHFRFPTSNNQAGWSEDFRQKVENYSDQARFDPELVEFWTGWIARSSNGMGASFNLHRFWKTYGPQRTRELFGAASTYISTRRSNNAPYIEEFAEFLCDTPSFSFDDSESTGRAVREFMHYHLTKLHESDQSITTMIRDWRLFAKILDDHLLGHAWASPIPAVPSPPAPARRGVGTSIKKTKDGHLVKTCLLTPVPLHLTDSEALELLFRDIQAEADAVVAWARHEVAEARLRVAARKQLAQTGEVNTVGAPCLPTGLRHRTSRECPEALAHAAATVEARGFDHLSTGEEPRLLYPSPLNVTSWELGIPSANVLLAYAIVLVHNHPEITPGFIEGFELLDGDGKQIGFIEDDSGWHLKSFKRRRGAELAEQDVLLNEETTQLVKDLIEATRPLRQWLEKTNQPERGLLFVSAASVGTRPRCRRVEGYLSSNVDWVASRFVPFVRSENQQGRLLWLQDAEAARNLARRITVRRIRSQQGVLVFLKTGSAEEMAKALGHRTWDPELLDHYLPRPIQEFFQERWVRLFQTGLICEALVDSPFLLNASPFDTMEELDSFLENHALKRIPAHLEDPTQVGGKHVEQAQDKVAFGIEIGILTLLMSLEAAVRLSIKEPCGRAIRRARISEKLVAHLETQNEQPEFRRIVMDARRNVDPSLVERFIYG